MPTSSFETRIFSFSRTFSTVGIIISLGFACLAALGFLLAGGKDTAVTYAEVEKALQPPITNESATISESLPDIDIPKNVEKYLGGTNRDILIGWLKALEEDQKQDFIDNLSDVIVEAEEANAEVITAINKYSTLKQSKYTTNEIEKYADKVAHGIYVVAAIVCATLGVLFSLVLVLLAIERNTRLSQ